MKCFATISCRLHGMDTLHCIGGFKAIQLIYTIQHNNNKIRKKTLYQIESMEIAQST